MLGVLERRPAMVGRLVAVVALGLWIAAVPVSAQARCSWLACTQVYNARSSQASVLVAAQWQTTTYNSSTKQTLRPNVTSTLRDVNAIWIPTGCTGTAIDARFTGGRWYKPVLDRYLIVVRC